MTTRGPWCCIPSSSCISLHRSCPPCTRLIKRKHAIETSTNESPGACIYRCSQPRVGVNLSRCAEDEKLLVRFFLFFFSFFSSSPFLLFLLLLMHVRMFVCCASACHNCDIFSHLHVDAFACVLLSFWCH